MTDPHTASGRGASGPDNIVDSFAALVEAIGGADFSTCFLNAMRRVAGVDLCSVFHHDGKRGVKLLFAAGEHAAEPDFPLHASRDYMRDHWRSDVQIRQLARTGGSRTRVVRRRAAEIADPAYRESCYDRAGVVERLSILCPGSPCLVINGYRTTTGAPDTAEALQGLECHAGLLTAVLKQHLRLQGADSSRPDKTLLTGRLMALDCGLSTREAEVSAALICGETQPEIARTTHLALATVVTYRRRAYDKLGVRNRRALAALHERLRSDPCRTTYQGE